MLSRRVVWLRGDLTTYSTTKAISKLLFLQSEDPHLPIHLILDSDGGDAIGGFAVIDAMNQITCPVYTFAPICAHAIAAIVLANGEPKYRLLTDRTELSFVSCVTEPENVEQQKTERALIDQIIEITGNDRAKIVSDHSTNRFFDPTSAIEYNLADSIVDSYPHACLLYTSPSPRD